MKRDIVLLANSRMHNARCIAGKDVNSGEWIRPKSKRTSNGAFYFNGNGPNILDCYRISFSNRCPLTHQPENIYVDGTEWVKTGE
ncbi:dual OB domain-containing protein [Methanohalophilus sp.]